MPPNTASRNDLAYMHEREIDLLIASNIQIKNSTLFTFSDMDFNVTSNFTKDQLESFYQLKQNIIELHGNKEAENEPRLVRFLIARRFNVARSTEMLSNTIRWRQKYGIDDLVSAYKMNEVLDKYFVESYLGFSKDGAVAVMGEAKHCDPIGICKSVTKADFLMYFIYLMELYNDLLEKKSKEEGRLFDKWFFIVNADKLPFSVVTNRECVEYFLSLLPIYEAYYPERLKTFFVINASMTTTIAYSLARPFLDERTRNKIKIFGRTGWQEELVRDVGADVLPSFMGGNRTDPDGNLMCNTIVKRPGTVPQRYYKRKTEKNLATKQGVKKYVISRRSQTIIELIVPEPGSRIEWEFQTENYDIGFGLQYVANENNDIRKEVEDILIPIQKMDTKVFSETGTYLCEKPGTYVIVFDNSFSWLRSKELYVRADIVLPNDDNICS